MKLFSVMQYSFFLVLAIVLVACSPSQQPSDIVVAPILENTENTCIQIGCIAPNFSLKTSTGGEIELHSLRGNPVFINFWATWCGFCVDEMPDIQSLFEEYYSQGLIVLGINQEESNSVVSEFVKNYGLTFILLLDNDGKISREYRVTGLPTSFFIDKHGVIQNVVIGSLSHNDMEETILSSLSLKQSGKTTVSSRTTLEGCVNTSSLRIRNGPGENYSVVGGLVRDECPQFNGRNKGSTWVRIYSENTKTNTDAYWVSSQYINLHGEIDILEVVP